MRLSELESGGGEINKTLGLAPAWPCGPILLTMELLKQRASSRSLVWSHRGGRCHCRRRRRR